MTEAAIDETGLKARIRVIIVDDHRVLSQGTARLLDREDDLEVVGIAADASQARALVIEAAPDVAVVDYQLPDEDGVALTKKILAIRPATRVLMLTGSTDDQVLLSAIEAGCTGFLTKDRSTEELVVAIRLAAAGEAYIPTGLVLNMLPILRGQKRGLGADPTPRELEILHLMRTGLSAQAIAAEAFLSVNTIRNHVQNILTKLNAHSKLEAVAIATRESLFSN